MPAEPKPERAWEIQPYQPGDESAILDMFNTEFGVSRAMEHWKWKFGSNPYGGPFISLARRHDDGRVVGNHVLMPFRLNVLGRPVLAGHSLDLVVRDGYRGQAIFETAGKHCLNHFRESGGRAVVAFPNADSYPGFIRSLGWNRIAFPRIWTLPLDLGPALSRAGLGPLGPVAALPARMITSARLETWRTLLRRQGQSSLVFESGTSVPAGFDDLWNACRSQEVVSLWKDAEYLNWRYVANPDHEFRFETLRDASGLQAMAVSVVRDGVKILCELIVRGRRVSAAQLLVCEVALRALASGNRSLQFFGHDAGFFAEVFASFRCRVAFENVFVGRSLAADDLDQRMAHAANWTLVYGDSDFV